MPRVRCVPHLSPRLSSPWQGRCEAILRSKPDSRTAAELHLACIDAIEEEEERRAKKIAIGGSAAVAVLGAAVAIGGMLLNKR